MSDPQTFIPEVIQAHVDEASYLFTEFFNEQRAAQPDSTYLQRTRERLNAHLDGLQVNPMPAWEIAEAMLADADAGEAFVIAYLAFDSGEFEKVKPIVERALEDADLFNAVAYGLALHSWERSGFWAQKFVTSTRPGIATLGLFCFQLHQQPCATHIVDLVEATLTANSTANLPLLLHQTKSLNEQGVLPLLQSMPLDTHCALSYESTKTRIAMGDQSAMTALKCFVMKENEYRESAVCLAFSVLDQAEAKQWMAELKQTEQADRYLLLAIGAMGETSLVPYIVKQMHEPKLARIAGVVFSALTGKNLRENNWVITDERFDDAWLDIEGDEELDWPDVDKLSEAMGL